MPNCKPTYVFLDLSWRGDVTGEKLPTKKAAKTRADELVAMYAKHATARVEEDADGDLFVLVEL